MPKSGFDKWAEERGNREEIERITEELAVIDKVANLFWNKIEVRYDHYVDIYYAQYKDFAGSYHRRSPEAAKKACLVAILDRIKRELAKTLED